MDKFQIFLLSCIILAVLLVEFLFFEFCLFLTLNVIGLSVLLDLALHYSFLIFSASKVAFIGSFDLFQLYLDGQYNSNSCKAFAGKLNHISSLLTDLQIKGMQINTRDYYFREIKNLSLDLLEEIKIFTLIASAREKKLRMSDSQLQYFKLVSQLLYFN